MSAALQSPADPRPTIRTTPGHANPVRMAEGQTRKRGLVHVFFTDFAPPKARRVWATMSGPTPLGAVQSMVRTLGLPPADLTARAQQLGDVAVLRRMPADLPREYCPGAIMPAAFIDGLTAQEVTDALADLAEYADRQRTPST